MNCEFFSGCDKKKAVVVGRCKFCKEEFCLSHRLPEQHQCKNIQECRNKARDYLAEKLTVEKILLNKI